jgi:predicted DNA-binding transcriptional regulator YafY
MTPLPARHAPAKGEKLALRLSRILALLHQGDTIDKHQLAQDFQVDVRTIERDLGERLQHIAVRNPEGRWQLARAARSSIPARHLHDYAQLSGTQHLFPDPSLQFLLEQLDKAGAPRALQVQPVRAEDLRGRSAGFAQLQTAIEARHECCFHYKGTARRAQPYRLLHRDGIWYLAAAEGGRLKNFSVARIEALQVDEASGFVPSPAHHAYIDAQEGVWFTEHTTEVLLRVAPPAAHYFARRALLPRQQQRSDTDGSLLVTAHINHPQQLLPLVRFWVPHVRIVRPAELHTALLDSLRQALTGWGD